MNDGFADPEEGLESANAQPSQELEWEPPTVETINAREFLNEDYFGFSF